MAALENDEREFFAMANDYKQPIRPTTPLSTPSAMCYSSCNSDMTRSTVSPPEQDLKWFPNNFDTSGYPTEYVNTGTIDHVDVQMFGVDTAAPSSPNLCMPTAGYLQDRVVDQELNAKSVSESNATSGSSYDVSAAVNAKHEPTNHIDQPYTTAPSNDVVACTWCIPMTTSCDNATAGKTSFGNEAPLYLHSTSRSTTVHDNSKAETAMIMLSQSSNRVPAASDARPRHSPYAPSRLHKQTSQVGRTSQRFYATKTPLRGAPTAQTVPNTYMVKPTPYFVAAKTTSTPQTIMTQTIRTPPATARDGRLSKFTSAHAPSTGPSDVPTIGVSNFPAMKSPTIQTPRSLPQLMVQYVADINSPSEALNYSHYGDPLSTIPMNITKDNVALCRTQQHLWAKRFFEAIQRPGTQAIPETLQKDGMESKRQRFLVGQPRNLQIIQGLIRVDPKLVRVNCILAWDMACTVHEYGSPSDELLKAKEKEDKGKNKTAREARVDLYSTCGQRLEKMSRIIQAYKSVALDVARGHNLRSFAQAPQSCFELKINYLKSNDARQVRYSSKKRKTTDGDVHAVDQSANESEVMHLETAQQDNLEVDDTGGDVDSGADADYEEDPDCVQ